MSQRIRSDAFIGANQIFPRLITLQQLPKRVTDLLEGALVFNLADLVQNSHWQLHQAG